MADIKEDIIQVDYIEVDKITYYTAVQVAEEIDESVSTVRSWAGKDFGEILLVETVNNRKCYTKEDIKKLKFIKELRKGNMSINQIKEYISKHGFRYANYDSGLVDVKDPLGFQALASALSIEVDSKLNAFMDKLVQRVGEMNKQQLQIISESLNETLMDTLDEKMEDYKNAMVESNKEVAITIDETVSDKFNSLENSLEEMKREFKIAYITNQSIKEYENPPNFLSKLSNLFKKH